MSPVVQPISLSLMIHALLSASGLLLTLSPKKTKHLETHPFQVIQYKTAVEPRTLSPPTSGAIRAGVKTNQASANHSPEGANTATTPSIASSPTQELRTWLGEYAAKMRKKIQDEIKSDLYAFPQMRSLSQATFQIRLNRDGKAQSIQIEKSSGHPGLDQALLQAVKNASPFGPLPVGRDELSFRLPVRQK